MLDRTAAPIPTFTSIKRVGADGPRRNGLIINYQTAQPDSGSKSRRMGAVHAGNIGLVLVGFVVGIG